MSSITEAIALASQSFTGQLLQPADAAYEARRRVHNGLIDKRPAAIASCHGVADVVEAVRLARTLGLEVAVRGGGHNVAGRAAIDQGLMIDVSPMKGHSRGPACGHCSGRGRRSLEGIQPRDTAARARHDRRRRREHGNRGSDARRRNWLADAEIRPRPRQPALRHVVMADGRVLEASAGENPDLFWAIRGGGGNFGIAASLEYTLHQVGPTITGGVVVHPFGRAFDVLRVFRDSTMSLPDEAMLVAALQTAPDGSNARMVGIVGCHCGSLEQGESFFRPLKAFGPPAMDVLGPMPYTTLNGMIDGAFPKGALSYWKAQFLTDLSDDAIRAVIAGFENCPSPMSHIIIEHFHGAASRVPVAATACTMRVTGFNVIIASQWAGSDETERGIAWARETFASLAPYLRPTRYVNYLEDDASDTATVAYGPNLPRLREIKTKYDPENFFRQNVNILPA